MAAPRTVALIPSATEINLEGTGAEVNVGVKDPIERGAARVAGPA